MAYPQDLAGHAFTVLQPACGRIAPAVAWLIKARGGTIRTELPTLVAAKRYPPVLVANGLIAAVDWAYATSRAYAGTLSFISLDTLNLAYVGHKLRYWDREPRKSSCATTGEWRAVPLPLDGETFFRFVWVDGHVLFKLALKDGLFLCPYSVTNAPRPKLIAGDTCIDLAAAMVEAAKENYQGLPPRSPGTPMTAEQKEVLQALLRMRAAEDPMPGRLCWLAPSGPAENVADAGTSISSSASSSRSSSSSSSSSSGEGDRLTPTAPVAPWGPSSASHGSPSKSSADEDQRKRRRVSSGAVLSPPSGLGVRPHHSPAPEVVPEPRDAPGRSSAMTPQPVLAIDAAQIRKPAPSSSSSPAVTAADLCSSAPGSSASPSLSPFASNSRATSSSTAATSLSSHSRMSAVAEGKRPEVVPRGDSVLDRGAAIGRAVSVLGDNVARTPLPSRSVQSEGGRPVTGGHVQEPVAHGKVPEVAPVVPVSSRKAVAVPSSNLKGASEPQAQPTPTPAVIDHTWKDLPDGTVIVQDLADALFSAYSTACDPSHFADFLEQSTLTEQMESRLDRLFYELKTNLWLYQEYDRARDMFPEQDLDDTILSAYHKLRPLDCEKITAWQAWLRLLLNGFLCEPENEDCVIVRCSPCVGGTLPEMSDNSDVFILLVIDNGCGLMIDRNRPEFEEMSGVLLKPEILQTGDVGLRVAGRLYSPEAMSVSAVEELYDLSEAECPA